MSLKEGHPSLPEFYRYREEVFDVVRHQSPVCNALYLPPHLSFTDGIDARPVIDSVFRKELLKEEINPFWLAVICVKFVNVVTANLPASDHWVAFGGNGDSPHLSVFQSPFRLKTPHIKDYHTINNKYSK